MVVFGWARRRWIAGSAWITTHGTRTRIGSIATYITRSPRILFKFQLVCMCIIVYGIAEADTDNNRSRVVGLRALPGSLHCKIGGYYNSKLIPVIITLLT